jgi:ATP-dependent exoDNAse (exonuclease V) beta subunit
LTEPSTQLVDAPARRTIERALDRTLLVEAAAGTGKTTALVARVLHVILSGAGPLRGIALLTFTEKAAGEIKLRLRSELDRALVDTARSDGERERAHQALAELETASIGTIHGFCVDLLQRYPVEAEVDPHFELLQGERERALLREVFDAWFARSLEHPPEGVRRVLARRSVSPREAAPDLQLMAAAHRLIETRDFSAAFRAPELDRAACLDALYSELRALAALQVRGSQEIGRAHV